MDNYTNRAKLPQSFTAGQPRNVQSAPKEAKQSFPRPAAAAAFKPTTVSKPIHEEIARRAYQIYISKGMPQGQSEQIWLQAEKELLGRD